MEESPPPQPAMAVPPPKDRDPYKLECNISRFQTQSVTMHPNKVHVTRHKSKAGLRPGVNQIKLTGLDPNIDEHSIKAAADNRWVFFSHATVEHVEPFEDDDSEATDVNDDSNFPENSDLVAARVRAQQLQDQLERARATLESTEARQLILHRYSARLSDGHMANITKCVDTFKQLQDSITKEGEEARKQSRHLERQWSRANTLVKKLEAQHQKEKDERMAFETRAKQASCTVRIFFYVDKRAVAGSTRAEPRVACNLTLSYANDAAFWFPKYALSLDTIMRRGRLNLSANYVNSTIETWEDCSVTFLTTAPTFRNVNGPDAAPPEMAPWNMGLAEMVDDDFEGPEQEWAWVDEGRPNVGPVRKRGKIAKNDLQSVEETLYREGEDGYLGYKERKRRAHMENKAAKKTKVVGFSDSTKGPPSSSGSLHTDRTPNEWRCLPQEFQEALMNEAEIVKYAAPGLRTIEQTGGDEPSRIHLGTVSLKDVNFTFYMTPKYDKRAFVKADIFNRTRLVLAPGAVTVTLDEKYAYDTHLPRCPAKSEVTVHLGHYPRIHAKYLKPRVTEQSFKRRLGEEGKNYEVTKRVLVLQNLRPRSGIGNDGNKENRDPKQKSQESPSPEIETPPPGSDTVVLEIKDQIPSADSEGVQIIPRLGRQHRGGLIVATRGAEEPALLRWKLGNTGPGRRIGEAYVRWTNDDEVYAVIEIDDGERMKVPFYYLVRTPAGFKLVNN